MKGQIFVVLQDGCAVFQAFFQGIKETSSFQKACPYRDLSFIGRQACLTFAPWAVSASDATHL